MIVDLFYLSEYIKQLSKSIGIYITRLIEFIRLFEYKLHNILQNYEFLVIIRKHPLWLSQSVRAVPFYEPLWRGVIFSWDPVAVLVLSSRVPLGASVPRGRFARLPMRSELIQDCRHIKISAEQCNPRQSRLLLKRKINNWSWFISEFRAFSLIGDEKNFHCV